MNNKIIPVAILGAGLLIGLAIFFKPTTSSDTITPAGAEVVIRPVDKNSHIVGSPSAKIVIVEYSDTECPYCKVFHKTMNDIVAKYQGEVAWVYRHFPIPELHSKAMKESYALECAGTLGGNTKFWEYTNALYELTPSNNGLPETALAEIAQKVGLNIAEFNSCLNDPKIKALVQADVSDVAKAGAQLKEGIGTPFSVILVKGRKNEVVSGALPFESLVTTIDSILAE